MKILIATIIFGLAINSNAKSEDCDSYREKIDRLQQLNGRGGKARQQAQRRKRIGHYESALLTCRNRQQILVAQGRQKIQKSRRKTMLINDTQSPQLQQLIKTCNYWVEQTSLHPSWDNSNYRDTACRAADESQKATLIRPRANARKLRDCIKPNKVIDHEVEECLRGGKAAYWQPGDGKTGY